MKRRKTTEDLHGAMYLHIVRLPVLCGDVQVDIVHGARQAQKVVREHCRQKCHVDRHLAGGDIQLENGACGVHCDRSLLCGGPRVAAGFWPRDNVRVRRLEVWPDRRRAAFEVAPIVGIRHDVRKAVGRGIATDVAVALAQASVVGDVATAGRNIVLWVGHWEGEQARRPRAIRRVGWGIGKVSRPADHGRIDGLGGALGR